MIGNDIIKTEDGTLIHDPYNPLNTEVTEADVCTILRKYGIPPELAHVNNIDLYKRAFVHPSYTKRPAYENKQLGIVLVDKPDNCLPLKTKSFQNLEFLGDGVLELVTKFYIYRRYSKSQEGFKSDLKIAVVKNESIGKIAAEMGLNKWMMLSHQAEENNLRYDVRKQLGNLFEAFLGALFLDFNKVPLTANLDLDEIYALNAITTGAGFQMANVFLESIFEQHVDWNTLINTNDNYKRQLQETVQKKFSTTPIYITLDHDNDTNMHQMGAFLCIKTNVNPKCETAADILKKVTMDMTQQSSCTMDALFRHVEERGGKGLVLLGIGMQNIKKNAEQNACHHALNILGLI
jgi:dsRNA-specific ribonuclease